jgi:hypothetical protein
MKLAEDCGMGTGIPQFTLLMWGNKNKTAEAKTAYIQVTS